MAVKGDYGKLDSLITRLGAADLAEFHVRLHKLCAMKAESLVKKEFRASTDPYGKAWAKLKYRQGKPLQNTGIMASSVHTGPNADGFYIEIDTSYAVYHQSGTKRIPKRQIIPEGAWPQEWVTAMGGIAETLFHKMFTK